MDELCFSVSLLTSDFIIACQWLSSIYVLVVFASDYILGYQSLSFVSVLVVLTSDYIISCK